ncbi:MAG: hypothetical protein WAK31_01800 [Chthoniobacterales bacterium]
MADDKFRWPMSLSKSSPPILVHNCSITVASSICRIHNGYMVSLRHHDDGRPIEVVDTYLTEESVSELLAGKGRDLEIILKPW